MTERENPNGVETTSLIVNPETLKDLLVAGNSNRGQVRGETSQAGAKFQHTASTMAVAKFQHTTSTRA